MIFAVRQIGGSALHYGALWLGLLIMIGIVNLIIEILRLSTKVRESLKKRPSKGLFQTSSLSVFISVVMCTPHFMVS